MSNYFHDKQVTLHKMRQQWLVQQNKMRLKVKIKDLFDWKVPKQITIKYAKNNQLGTVSIIKSPNIPNHQSTKKLKPQLKYIAGVDISATRYGAYEYDAACAAVMIYEYPSFKLIHQETEIVKLQHPYIAGFLAFREVSHFIKLINKIKKQKPSIIPQIILVAGNGILHYRRVGLATHLSIAVNIPCIGIAKKLLAIDNLNVNQLVPLFNQRLKTIGSFCGIYGWNNEHVGYAVRSHKYKQVIYVSPGHLIGFESCLKIVMVCLDKYGRFRLPLPTEKASFVARKIIQAYQKEYSNPYVYSNNSEYSHSFSYQQNNHLECSNSKANNCKMKKNKRRRKRSRRGNKNKNRLKNKKCVTLMGSVQTNKGLIEDNDDIKVAMFDKDKKGITLMGSQQDIAFRDNDVMDEIEGMNGSVTLMGYVDCHDKTQWT